MFLVMILVLLVTTPPIHIKAWEDCVKRSSCSDTALSLYPTLEERNCFCDELCNHFDDCCRDVSTPQAFPEYSTGGAFECALYEMHILEHVRHPLTFTDQALNRWPTFRLTINRCPQGFDDPTIKRLCEGGVVSDPLDSNPLTDVLVSGAESGLLFKNVFCASCHSAFQIEDVLFWQQLIDCTYPPEISRPPQLPDTAAPPPPPGAEVPLVAGVPASGQETSESVNATWESLQWEYCVRHLRLPSGVPEPRQCKTAISECAADWDTTSNYGRTVASMCSNHTNYTYSPDAFGPKYRNEYCAECNYNPFTTCVYPFHLQSGHGFGTLPSMRLLLDFNQGSLTRQILDGQEMQSTGQMFMATDCAPNEIMDIYSAQCRPKFCADGQTVSENSMQCEGSVNHPVTNLTCVLTYLNSSEYSVTNETQLFITVLGISLGRENYVRLNGSTVAVCAELFSSSYAWIFSISSFERYITVIGYTLSMAGLLVLFVIYMLLPQLRNLPGKCLLNLVAALFFSQLLFLLIHTPRPNSAPCLVLSVAVHYLYLVSFFWMNVLGFDIWRTFQFHSLNHDGHGARRRLVAYHLYAWLVPLLTILVALLIDYNVILSADLLKPRYGHRYCWISSKWGLVCFFAAPIGLLLLANVVFFTMTLWNIYRTSREAVAASKGHVLSRKRQLILNIKLSAVMGLTWLFGFLALALPRDTALWYLFIIFGSLQGVVICLGFVCSKNVFRLMKGKAASVRESSKTAQSRLATHTGTEVNRLVLEK